LNEGDDVSEVLGIVKYEPPVPAQLAGLVKGNFPSQIPKTDAERIQNLSRELNEWIEQKIKFEVTIKLDGSSMTVAKIGDDIHVCSRNLSLKLDQDGNTFVEAAKKYALINKLKDYPIDLAIQGELIGPGIQNNQEKLSSHEFYVFEIYDIKGGRYLSPTDRYKVCDELGLKHTPVPHASIELSELGLKTVDDALAFAEGKSLNPAVSREGVVFKNEDGSIKWKSISNSWLMKNGE
jgi:RNA ligase (TIGR02306 family)